MSLARATISGKVYRAPEKRFTANNIPITAFTLDINTEDETLIRVVSKGNLAETVVNTVAKGDMVVVEGRLQNATVKTENGAEKRIVEIDASAVEKLSQSGASASVQSAKFAETEQIVQFGSENDFADDLIGEDEIPF